MLYGVPRRLSRVLPFVSPINRTNSLPMSTCQARPYSSFRNNKPRVILSGIQPTGVPHLGNYLGALQQWEGLQASSPASTKLLFPIVDLHAITQQQDALRLRRWKLQTLASLLAIGLKPERCSIFFQSAVGKCKRRAQGTMADWRAGSRAYRIDVDPQL